ncbi:thioredoxin family protein [Jeotgalibacillus haloalkalitolerans]|uniref:Thioredoxin family protein n=1 Tax=Jeotgalibacillus haloalkalitolerans TaxID=3104292 RepID=A0ABU5KPD4_9BACL|nr:thioredoxin family protein [Jeotgalibacillus sp. HH7-29]MDZ5713122.1 thioredoxin family protein [Jeotgalibacillus sp. HH7-29]
MKKILIFGGVIVLIFAAIALITNMQNASKTEDNPYGKDDLDQSTIDLLDDENYQNQIVPEDLEERISSGEPTTVYFFSPECQYCLETTPMLAPLAEEMDVDMVQHNLIEFQDSWNKYGIQSTPTLIHYEDGEAVDGIVGAATEEDYRAFFERNVTGE